MRNKAAASSCLFITGFFFLKDPGYSNSAKKIRSVYDLSGGSKQ